MGHFFGGTPCISFTYCSYLDDPTPPIPPPLADGTSALIHCLPWFYSNEVEISINLFHQRNTRLSHVFEAKELSSKSNFHVIILHII